VPAGHRDDATDEKAGDTAGKGRRNADFEHCSPRSRGVHIQANDEPSDRPRAACQHRSGPRASPGRGVRSQIPEEVSHRDTRPIIEHATAIRGVRFSVYYQPCSGACSQRYAERR
jgi:hypothetical protein